MFLVLFYVYPLKFLFTLVTNQWMGVASSVLLADGRAEAMIEREQVPRLMVIYGLGFVAVFLVFALLYHHAYRRRAELRLDMAEVLMTRGSIEAHLLTAGVGLVSILIAVVGAPPTPAWRVGATVSSVWFTQSTAAGCARGCAGSRTPHRPQRTGRPLVLDA